MMGLNVEEIQLAACYKTSGSRLQMIKAVVKAKENMDVDIRPVAVTLVDKLARMSDEEFNSFEFQEEVEW